MHRIDSTGAVASLPTPRAVGSTVGYFNNAVPGAGVAPTLSDPDWCTMVQEEIINCGLAAGLTPAKGNYAQLLQALAWMFAPIGECRLAVASGTSLVLSPYNGNGLKIAGVRYAIPTAGISIANTGLAATTLYHAYAWNNAGTLALELSTTGHATDTAAGNVGVEIKSGDNSRTYVGMVYTAAGTPGPFSLCRSWFNRVALPVNGTGGSGTCTSLTWSDACAGGGTPGAITFLAYADDAVWLGVAGAAGNSGSGYCQFAVMVDGVVDFPTTFTTGTANMCVSAFASLNLAEGVHTAAIGVQVPGGGAGFFAVQLAGRIG